MKVINSETSGCGAEEDRNLHKENDLLKAEVKSLKVELAANKVDSNSDRQSDKHMRQQGCFQKQLNEYRQAERQKFYKQAKYKWIYEINNIKNERSRRCLFGVWSPPQGYAN